VQVNVKTAQIQTSNMHRYNLQKCTNKNVENHPIVKKSLLFKYTTWTSSPKPLN